MSDIHWFWPYALLVGLGADAVGLVGVFAAYPFSSAPIIFDVGRYFACLDVVATLLAIAAWVAVIRGVFRRTKAEHVAAHVGRSDEMKVEYVPGFLSAGAHEEILVWWTSPPVLFVDSAFREMPAFRDYLVWFHRRRLDVIRTRRTTFRWLRLAGLELAKNIGLAQSWFLIRNASGGAT